MLNSAWVANNKGEITIIHGDRVATVPGNHPKHGEILNALRSGLFISALNMADLHTAISEAFFRAYHQGMELKLERSSTGRITLAGQPLDMEVGEQAIRLIEAGSPVQPLLLMLHKLQKNPDKDIKKQLLPFLVKNDFQLDPFGNIIAWKKVYADPSNKLWDLWTKRIEYTPPITVTMPRDCAVKDPHNACGAGLHFATWDYTYNYSGDTVVELLVSPEHVVSIPYSEVEKGRCYQFRVTREIKDWRSYSAGTAPRSTLNNITLNEYEKPEFMQRGFEDFSPEDEGWDDDSDLDERDCFELA